MRESMKDRCSGVRGVACKLPWAAGLLAVVLLFQAAELYAAWGTIRPAEGGSKVMVEVNGKKRTYWRVEDRAPVDLELNGPAVLRVISRAPWKLGYKGKKYGLVWSIDGGEERSIRHSIRRSQVARLAKKGKRLAESRTDEIRIPPGTHRVRLRLGEGAADHLLLRLKKRFIHPIPKGRNIDKLPLVHGEVREVVVRENAVTYYTLASGDELEAEVIGPTFMKIISRLDWNPTMSGPQRYMLRIFEDGELKNTYVLKGRRSDVAVYADKRDSVPAKGEVLYVEVPEGRHKYTVRFKDSGREVNLRFLIPRNSLRNVDE